MQENANAINIEMDVIRNFGQDNVQVLSDGIIKLKLKELGNGDILNISNLLLLADIHIKRSDKNILVLFTPISSQR